jgi:pyruvate formate lyase activating enzyme
LDTVYWILICMLTGIVFDLMRFSTRDGPGIRTTVFLKGCPLSCLWCHNPESQRLHPELMFRPNLCISCLACIDACEQGGITLEDGVITTDLESCILCEACVAACYSDAREIVGQKMSVVEVMAEIRKDLVFYDESGGGVTFSGGEPLLQTDFLLALLQACKAEGIHTAVDTSGYAAWEEFEAISPYVDLFLYDLKTIDDAVHIQATGVSNALILSNLSKLSQRGSNLRVRVPVIPGINDSPEAIQSLGEFLAALPHPPVVELLPYHLSGVEKYHRLGRSYQLEDIQPPTAETMHGISTILREWHVTFA